MFCFQEYLYLEIAELLNQGRQWELAVEVIKELVSVYEEEALGYGPLAELHAQLASLYAAMLKTPRSHPGYFRVIYHGKGFPEILRKPNVSLMMKYLMLLRLMIFLFAQISCSKFKCFEMHLYSM